MRRPPDSTRRNGRSSCPVIRSGTPVRDRIPWHDQGAPSPVKWRHLATPASSRLGIFTGRPAGAPLMMDCDTLPGRGQVQMVLGRTGTSGVPEGGSLRPRRTMREATAPATNPNEANHGAVQRHETVRKHGEVSDQITRP